MIPARAWLLAYPRDYRRRHGLELLTTLMDASRPERPRPDRADIVDLIRGGLRQRFRLPVGRWMLVFAILAAVIGAGTGAAAGAWAGWRGNLVALPEDSEVIRLSGLALDRSYPVGARVQRNDQDGIPSLFVWTDTAFDRWDAQAAATAIAAEGWDVGPIATGPYLDEHRRTAFIAERDGVLLRYTVEYTDDVAYGGVNFQPAVPWIAYLLAVAGALTAAVAVWLFIAWASYRMRRAASRWRVAGVLSGVATLVALALPTLGIFVTMVEAALPDPLNTRGAYPLWGTFTAMDQFYVVAAVFLLVSALVALTGRPAAPRPALTPLA
jgi:hypothetical protein